MRTKVKQDAGNAHYSDVEELERVERGLVGYNTWIVAQMARHCASTGEVADFGAGTGTLAAEYLAQTGTRPVCVEIDPRLTQRLRARGFETLGTLEGVRGRFTSIYSSNVLEHIADDAGALETLHRALEPGGRLALYLPALQWAYCDVDAAVGHYRRYDRRALRARLEASGFRVEAMHYADCTGLAALALIKALGVRKSAAMTRVDVLERYDRWVWPVSRTLDAWGMRHVAGKNLVAWATAR